MHPLDVLVIIILFIGFIWGFTKGFIYMIFSLLAILLGVFLAGLITPMITKLFFSGLYYKIGYIFIFMIVFTVVYFIVRQISGLFESLVDFLDIEWLDSLIGGVLGFLQFFIITGVILNFIISMNLIVIIPDYQKITYSYSIAQLSNKFILFLVNNFKNIKLPNKLSLI